MPETTSKKSSSKNRKPYVKPTVLRVRLQPEDRAFLHDQPELGDNPAFWDSSVALSPAVEKELAHLLAKNKEEIILTE